MLLPMVGQVIVFKPLRGDKLVTHGTGIVLKAGDRFIVTKTHSIKELMNGDAVVEARALAHNETLEEWDQELHIYMEAQECSEINLEDFEGESPTETLFPCPFCGGQASVIEHSTADSALPPMRHVCCHGCGVQTRPGHYSPGFAILTWNQRSNKQ